MLKYFPFFFIFSFYLTFFAIPSKAATINLTVKFSEVSLNKRWFSTGDAEVFGLAWYTCIQTPGNSITVGGTATCPEGQAPFDNSWFIRSSDKIDTNTWLKVIHVPETYTGKVTIELWAPTTFKANPNVVFNSSVTDCLSLADNEMSGEVCGQHGSPWTVTITDPKQEIALTTFPAFGIGSTGVSKILLSNFYSPQLKNYRDISAYLPPSLLQNKVSRPINVMVILDGSLSTIQSYSKNTGFESGQLMGVVPESIMIGITTAGFAYQGTSVKHYGAEGVKDFLFCFVTISICIFC